jgi:hypothetical protein
MSSHLADVERNANRARAKHRPKNWTPERRARQAAQIRSWRPWLRSTGPRSETGKERSALNALRHGFCSRDWLLAAAGIREVLRASARNIQAIRGFCFRPRLLLRPRYSVGKSRHAVAGLSR